MDVRKFERFILLQIITLVRLSLYSERLLSQNIKLSSINNLISLQRVIVLCRIPETKHTHTHTHTPTHTPPPTHTQNHTHTLTKQQKTRTKQKQKTKQSKTKQNKNTS